jgi:hypothetical protein
MIKRWPPQIQPRRQKITIYSWSTKRAVGVAPEGTVTHLWSCLAELRVHMHCWLQRA